MNDDSIINVRELTVTYRNVKNPTLKNISFTVKKGNVVLVLGPSGSGKTTLTRCLNGLIPYSYPAKVDGEITIAGMDPREEPIYKISLKVGTVLQNPENQFVGLTVAEDVAFGLENLMVPRERIREIITENLKKVGMLGFEERSPHELSGGEKQKVAIAGVLAMSPEILIFDEPLANLDPISADEMLNIINELNEKYQKTILIIEHRFEEVLTHLRRLNKVLVISSGEVVYDGPPDALIRENANLLENIGIRLPLYSEIVYNVKKKKQKLMNIPIPVTLDEAATLIRNLITSSSLEHYRETKTREIENHPAISLRNVSFEYPGGVKAVDNVSFDIYPGESVALLGHNGAGKSTLALLMLGILKPTKGDVIINGKNTKSITIAQNARNIGLVMQNPDHMLFQKTVELELEFGPKNLGYDQKKINELVNNALEITNLKKYRNWPPMALSLGQRKRVGLAAILSMNSKILLLDEPTAGQDWRHTQLFMTFIEKLISKKYTLVLITHDMNLALEYTDRAIVMAHGKKIADGPTSEILSHDEVINKSRLKPSTLISLSKRLGLTHYIYKIEDLVKMIN
ncbi:MAG: ABC transporter ATP-binding protein [Candidatus Asgardarchaeum californiense]|nr:MAG: ABC transporter ATP-binding protein [Candidatus Asgardarchaeum californiense]